MYQTMSNYYQPNTQGGGPTAPTLVEPRNDGSGGGAPTSSTRSENTSLSHNVMAMGGYQYHSTGDGTGRSYHPNGVSLVCNSIKAHLDGNSHRMSKLGVPQHVEMQTLHRHHSQQQDYPTSRQSFPHLSPIPYPNSLPASSHHFPQIPYKSEFEQHCQVVIPPLPLPPPPLPPPLPPPTGISSQPTTSQVVKPSTTSSSSSSSRECLPTSRRDPNNDINQTVDAINALSNLEKRWSAAPAIQGKRQQTKNSAKRKKRRRNHKKNNEVGKDEDDDDERPSESRVIIRDAGEGEEWINVMDSPSTENAPLSESQHALQLSMSKEENELPLISEEIDPRIVSLAHDFPPLPSSTSRENGSARLDPLTSYATVLKRSLDDSGSSGKHDSTNQVIQFLQDNDEEEEEEMDISDDEPESQVRKDDGACKGGDGLSDMNVSTEVTVNGIENPHSIQQEQEKFATKKRALKLAELKAKAKLARAKLRIAEEKNSRGKLARELRETTEVVVALRPFSLLIPHGLPDDTAVHDGKHPEAENAMQVDEKSNATSRQQDTVQDNSASIPQVISTPITLAKEEEGMNAKSLKQKLHLARLKLEIKKKEREKRELEMKRQAHSAGGFDTDDIEAKLPSGIPLKVEAVSSEHSKHRGNLSVSCCIDPIDTGVYNNIVMNHSKPTKRRDRKELGAKLVQLQQRQKELKQQNDNANLRHLIRRQRELLQAQHKELVEITSQLHSCTDGLKLKQDLLDQSENRVEEMKHRKRIIEGMGLRATEQLMIARKALNERRSESH